MAAPTAALFKNTSSLWASDARPPDGCRRAIRIKNGEYRFLRYPDYVLRRESVYLRFLNDISV